MSITANAKVYIKFDGDQASEVIYSSGELSDSPNLSDLKTLAIGNNEIVVPTVDDFTVHGVLLVPPVANTDQLTLKGIAGDTGVQISANQPTLLQFGDTLPASLFVSVAAEVVGLRLIWF